MITWQPSKPVICGVLLIAALGSAFYAGTRYSQQTSPKIQRVPSDTSGKPVRREDGHANGPGEQARDPNMIATLQRDGTRVVWLQRADSLTLNKYSFDSDGALAFIVIYRIDPHGNPLNCRIYDKYQTELFKGSYGYRKSNGELVEERFFDSRTKHLSPSGDEIPVRRIIFSDVRGKAFEPVVITDPLACMGDELAEFPAEPFHNPFMLKHEN